MLIDKENWTQLLSCLGEKEKRLKLNTFTLTKKFLIALYIVDINTNIMLISGAVVDTVPYCGAVISVTTCLNIANDGTDSCN